MGVEKIESSEPQELSRAFTQKLGESIADVYLSALPDFDESDNTLESRKGFAEWIGKECQDPDQFWTFIADPDNEEKALASLNGIVATKADKPDKVPANLLFDNGDPIDPEEVFYVDTVAVSTEAQGQGLGGRIMQETYDYVKRHPKYRYVFLRTDRIIHGDQHNPALDFYEKQGFQNLGESQEGKPGKIHFIKKIEDIDGHADTFADRVGGVIEN